MAITQVSDLSTIQTMFDQRSFFALRPELGFDQVADVQPADPGPRSGNVATFTIWQEPAVQTSALSETSDVTAVTLGDDQVSVTIAEQGAAFGTTRRVLGTSFLKVMQDLSNLAGYNAGISIDTIARDALAGGTNVVFVGQSSQAAITSSNIITSAVIRKEVAALRAANVQPHEGGLYIGFIHPDNVVDIMQEATANTVVWHEPADFSDANRRWMGEIGVYEGVRWITTPRAALIADAGATTTDVYQTYIVGRQALAKAVDSLSRQVPEMVVSPVVDKLKRFFHYGWYQNVGYDTFREAACRRIESASSIGAN